MAVRLGSEFLVEPDENSRILHFCVDTVLLRWKQLPLSVVVFLFFFFCWSGKSLDIILPTPALRSSSFSLRGGVRMWGKGSWLSHTLQIRALEITSREQGRNTLSACSPSSITLCDPRGHRSSGDPLLKPTAPLTAVDSLWEWALFTYGGNRHSRGIWTRCDISKRNERKLKFYSEDSLIFWRMAQKQSPAWLLSQAL